MPVIGVSAEGAIVHACFGPMGAQRSDSLLAPIMPQAPGFVGEPIPSPDVAAWWKQAPRRCHDTWSPNDTMIPGPDLIWFQTSGTPGKTFVHCLTIHSNSTVKITHCPLQCFADLTAYFQSSSRSCNPPLQLI